MNECLYKDPQTTPLIFDILLRFRTFKISLAENIEKIFPQIAINEKDRDFLRSLWFDNVFRKQTKIVRNRFARVIFSVTSSPYLYNETICKHAQKYDFDPDFKVQYLTRFMSILPGEKIVLKALFYYSKS